MTTPPSKWAEIIARDPGHSQRYIERWRNLAASGQDIEGETRFADALLARGSSVLDAGCGTGRVGGPLARAGHQVVGVDIDPVLIEQARRDFPQAVWEVGDLAELELADADGPLRFDLVLCAGNVVAFLHPATRVSVLRRMGGHLRPRGRVVVGFGSGPGGYSFEDFFADVAEAGLRSELLLSTWDLRPFPGESGFCVAVLSRA